GPLYGHTDDINIGNLLNFIGYELQAVTVPDYIPRDTYGDHVILINGKTDPDSTHPPIDQGVSLLVTNNIKMSVILVGDHATEYLVEKALETGGTTYRLAEENIEHLDVLLRQIAEEEAEASDIGALASTL
ncbi:PREDICTED: uncharacterized protein LOC106820399, partial [Priapulus caudatus]|uniref:Uncharacterized protein LOC106820399 n=1 Tax=Priapulus caudatus TaxID=37621 RepID=A0ABM1F7I3_PRICU